ncbi:MAG: ABC transporter ATP-binding protein [Elusimicrobia bacterium]|nr:ABC transporter ATP-binding protein [Elusimicrobiota bacterium]
MEHKPSDWRELFPYMRGRWDDFSFAAFSMGVVALLSSVSMGLIKPIIDQIFIDKDVDMLRDLAWIVPGIFLAKGVFSYFLNYLITKIGHGIARDIREELVGRLLLQDHAFHNRNKSSDLLSRATNDIAAVANMTMNVPLFALRDGLTVVFLLALIFYLNARFAALLLFTIPVFALIFVTFTKSLRRVTYRAQELIAGVYSIIAEAIDGLTMIKIYLYERAWLGRFSRQNHDYYKAMVKFQRLTALSPSLMEFLSGVVITWVLWWGGIEVIRGSWSAGDFLAFLGASFAAYQPIKHLSQVNSIIQLGLASWSRVAQVKNAPIGIVAGLEQPSARDGEFCSGIVFEDVHLIYPDGRGALEGIDLKISKGEVLGLAGPSGSGKSTLAMLLARFYDPTRGAILIDGRNIRDWDISSLRKLFAFVTQDAFLFDDTIAANIAIGNPQAGPGEIEAAAKAANAWEFIQRLPRGLETVAGERGMQLSAGQRQRIAIARAVLKQAPILILDEATSNLDPESEELVLAALGNLLKGKTAIVISHRIQTLVNTGRIVVIERGRIIEETTLPKLMSGESGRLAALMRA